MSNLVCKIWGSEKLVAIFKFAQHLVGTGASSCCLCFLLSFWSCCLSLQSETTEPFSLPHLPPPTLPWGSAEDMKEASPYPVSRVVMNSWEISLWSNLSQSDGRTALSEMWGCEQRPKPCPAEGKAAGVGDYSQWWRPGWRLSGSHAPRQHEVLSRQCECVCRYLLLSLVSPWCLSTRLWVLVFKAFSRAAFYMILTISPWKGWFHCLYFVDGETEAQCGKGLAKVIQQTWESPGFLYHMTVCAMLPVIVPGVAGKPAMEMLPCPFLVPQPQCPELSHLAAWALLPDCLLRSLPALLSPFSELGTTQSSLVTASFSNCVIPMFKTRA